MGRHLLWAITIAVVTVALASPSQARRKRAKKGSVALFPATGDNDEILTEVNRMLDAAVREAGLAVISGPTLKRRLKSAPAQAYSRCFGNPACIAKLAKKARTELAAVAFSTGSGDGIVVAFQIVTTKGRVEREATVEIATVADTREALAGLFETLFLVPPPSTLTGDTDAALVAMGDLALLPLEPVEEFPLELEPEPEPEPDPLALSGVAELTDPLEDDPDIEPAPDPGPMTIAAVDPAVSEPEEPSQWLFVTSIVLAGGGALVAGTGGFFGVRSMMTVNDANDDKSIDQVRAGTTIQEDADNDQSRAKLLYILGGALAGLGGVLLTVDLLTSEDVQPSVSVSADGASAGVTISF
jgi:hypothetical protein